MTCTACAAFVPEDAFLCPACGTAVIPQTSKMQSRAGRFDKANNWRWPLRGAGVGLAVGAVTAAAVLAVRYEGLPPPAIRFNRALDVTYAALCGGAFGCMAGMFANLVKSVRAQYAAARPSPPAEPPP